MADHLKIERVGGYAGLQELLYDGPLREQARRTLGAALAGPAEVGADIPSLRVTVTHGGHTETHQVTEGSSEAEALLNSLQG